MKYYFLGSAFPELHLGAPPELGFHELSHLLKNNLTEEDYAKVDVIRRYYDIQNLRSLWKEEDLDKWGNLDKNELEDAVLTGSGFVQMPYVSDFLQQHGTTEERLRHFPQLVAGYFNEEMPAAKGFLFDYLKFEREMRLVLAAFRAKKMRRNIFKELQYDNPDDVQVAQILAQKDAPQYEPPAEYSHLKPLFEKYYHEPFELYQALCQYQFDTINEMAGIDPFSIDGVLAYLAKYIIADKWLELDRKKGLKIVDAIIKGNS